MPFEEKVSLKGTRNLIYHTFINNMSHQNPTYLLYCCWQLISDKEMKHTEKDEMTKETGVRVLFGTSRTC